METDQGGRAGMLGQLDVLVGEWSLRAGIPDSPEGRVSFEWGLGGQFLVERTEIPHPQAPDALCIIGVRADGRGYTQHYFDSRGVVRLYQMTLAGGLWTLVRAAPDFTPLDFSQRYIGRLTPDGQTITGAWETSTDAVTWSKDFDLTYVKVA